MSIAHDIPLEASLGHLPGPPMQNSGNRPLHRISDARRRQGISVRSAARRMQTGGRIVNISSISGRSGRPDQAPYAAAKAGVISLTRSAALALAPLGITVNAVCPGVVDTPLTRRIHADRARVLGITPDASLAAMAARIPLGRLETTEDVAGVVAFLCSPAASYMTGQALNVCGGMEMD